MDKAAGNPEVMRLVYAAEAGFGLWLAMSQIRHLSGKRNKSSYQKGLKIK